MSQVHEVSVEVDGKTYRAWYQVVEGHKIDLLGLCKFKSGQRGGSITSPEAFAKLLLCEQVKAGGISESGVVQ